MNLRDQMEEIYRQLPLERIPWNLEQPPKLLADLVHTELDTAEIVGKYGPHLAVVTLLERK